MSRIGKKPVIIPAGVEVKITPEEIRVSGKRGELLLKPHPRVKIEITEINGQKTALFSVISPDDKKDRALWGLFARLFSNMIKGVTDGYEEKLELIGVGFKAAVSGRNLVLEVGLSHPVEFPLPAGVEVKIEKNAINISGSDKWLVGEVAARIRRVKKPEPYKGKGIKYRDEVIRRKAGKAAKTAAAAAK